MTKGAGSPANQEVFFNAMPASTMMASPRKYIPGAMNTELGKNTAVIMPMISALAPQGIKVASKMVMRRSRSSSMVRAAMMAGTPQPMPMSTGIKDLPDRPN